MIREARQLRGKAAKYTHAKLEPGARREIRQEARELVADARRIEQRVVEKGWEKEAEIISLVCANAGGAAAGAE